MPFNRNQQIDPTDEDTSLRFYIADQDSPNPGEIRLEVTVNGFSHDTPASDLFTAPRLPTIGDFTAARVNTLVAKGFSQT